MAFAFLQTFPVKEVKRVCRHQAGNMSDFAHLASSKDVMRGGSEVLEVPAIGHDDFLALFLSQRHQFARIVGAGLIGCRSARDSPPRVRPWRVRNAAHAAR